MNEMALDRVPLPTAMHPKIFKGAVLCWYSIAAAGHWIFLAYILAVFYPPIANNGLEGLDGLHLPSGFREGEFLGNLAAASHVLLAAIIIGGGPLQLLPAIRNRFPAFHRGLGKAYLSAAVLSSLGGLYMVWTRGSVGNLVNHLGISGDAILILVFSAMTIYHARARRIRDHRRWALRLFMAASAVWFFRVGLMAWVMLTGGVGMDFETFTGPAIYVLGFAQYLLPLAMLQWYFHCQDNPSAGQQIIFASVLTALSLFMAVGVVAATMGMWIPRM